MAPAAKACLTTPRGIPYGQADAGQGNWSDRGPVHVTGPSTTDAAPERPLGQGAEARGGAGGPGDRNVRKTPDEPCRGPRSPRHGGDRADGLIGSQQLQQHDAIRQPESLRHAGAVQRRARRGRRASERRSYFRTDTLTPQARSTRAGAS